MEKGDRVKMSKLIQKSNIIYEYLTNKRNVVTYMSLRPQQALIEKNLVGLGCTLENAGSKKCLVNIENLQHDLQKMLVLSYYSLQLCPAFLIEGCISLYLQNFFEKSSAKPVGSPISVKELTKDVKFYADLLRNEHMLNYD